MGQYRITCGAEVMAKGPARSLIEAARRAIEIRAEEPSRVDDYAVEELVHDSWHLRMTLHRTTETSALSSG